MAEKKVPTVGEDQRFIKNISRFAYFSNENWLPFPNWARYFLELGASLSCYESEGSKFVAAITIPVRAFASSLIASGIIIPRIGLPTHNLQSHISKIESFPIGTPVSFRTNNRRYDGYYRGTTNVFGKSYFKINYQQGGDIFIAFENSYKIELSEKQISGLPNIQSGRQLQPPSPLIKHVFEPNFLNKFLTESKIECLILGQQKAFQQELCNFQIGYQLGEERVASGRIIDFVRVRGNQFQPSNLSYRSYVLPSSGHYNQQFTSKLNNYVTIFDNPLGFIKWRNNFKNSNWFVVLDKTDRNFDLAINEINEEYIQNRLEKPIKVPLPNPPAGVDLMFFEVSS